MDGDIIDKGYIRVLGGLCGPITGFTAGILFEGFADVNGGWFLALVLSAGLGTFIGIGGELKAAGRRVFRKQSFGFQQLWNRTLKTALIGTILGGLTGLVVGLSHLLLGRLLEEMVLWAIIGTGAGTAIGLLC